MLRVNGSRAICCVSKQTKYFVLFVRWRRKKGVLIFFAAYSYFIPILDPCRTAGLSCPIGFCRLLEMPEDETTWIHVDNHEIVPAVEAIFRIPDGFSAI